MPLILLIVHGALWALRALLLALFGGLWAGFLAGTKHGMNVRQSRDMVEDSRRHRAKLP